MECTLKSITGKTYKISSCKLVRDLKMELSNLIHEDPANISLLYKQFKLNDDDAIPSIPEGDFIIFSRFKQVSSLGPKEVVTNFSLYQDSTGKPYNYDDMVKVITNLQFSREHAEAALLFSHYNLNDAVTMLVTGVPVNQPDNKTKSALRSDTFLKTKISPQNSKTSSVEKKPNPEEQKTQSGSTN